MSNKKKVNKNEKDNKKPFIKTKAKMDNSVEVELTKSPAKTTGGRILVWVIAIGTILVPVCALIALLIQLAK